jgi:hypothetical protein
VAQDFPFQCAASGTVAGAVDEAAWLPTTSHERADEHDTP